MPRPMGWRHRIRTQFSDSQKLTLEKSFVFNPHPVKEDLTNLAKKMRRDKKSICNWFYNRRRIEIMRLCGMRPQVLNKFVNLKEK
jgi:hypothetical protein